MPSSSAGDASYAARAPSNSRLSYISIRAVFGDITDIRPEATPPFGCQILEKHAIAFDRVQNGQVGITKIRLLLPARQPLLRAVAFVLFR